MAVAGEVLGVVPWVLSARTPEALRGQARVLVERLLDEPGLRPTEVGWSLLTTRTRFDHRAVAVGEDRESFLTALEALTTNEPHPAIVTAGPSSESAPTGGDTVFLFS
ncbi:hypothetical protein AAHZ94_35100, partial [Streptomyces sp. HSW2009]|uniref:CurL C-terminal domain-containing protein n=1 Tax=Streptomyces sp. HSW2009 TaxID=3142890 RepID=UPI0032EFE341